MRAITGRINWRWIAFRFGQIGRCSHQWTTGDRVGHRACGRCGTWRWFPLVRSPAEHDETGQ